MFDGLTEAAADLRSLEPPPSTTFMVAADDDLFRITIKEGRVASVERGPFVMPNCDFRIGASRETWALFLRPTPPPGSHDLFALMKRGALELDGSLHPFMSNLMFFKRLFACLRSRESAS